MGHTPLPASIFVHHESHVKKVIATVLIALFLGIGVAYAINRDNPQEPAPPKDITTILPSQPPTTFLTQPIEQSTIGIDIHWNAAASGKLSSIEKSAIEQGLAHSPGITAIITSPEITLDILSFRTEGDWATIYSEVNVPVGSGAPPGAEPLTILGQRLAGTWSFVPDSDDSFCDVLEQVPESLLDSESRAFYVGCE